MILNNIQSKENDKPKLQMMDITSLKAVLSDLRRKIVPGRFEKVQQLDSSTLQIGFRSLEGLTWIELSWSSDSARIVEIEPPPKIEGESTLSKQIKFGLKGMALIELKQKGFDRVVEFGFAFRTNELVKKYLLIEIMGRHSNMLLLDEKKEVITLGKQIRNSQSRLRPICTGDSYVSPPSLQGLKPNKDVNFEEWRNSLLILPITLKQALIETFQGMSPALILQLASDKKEDANRVVNMQVKKLTDSDWENLFYRWNKWIDSLEKESFHLSFSGPTPYRVWMPIKSKQDFQNDISLRLGIYYREFLNSKKLYKLFNELSKELEKTRFSEEKKLEHQEYLYLETSDINSIKEKADNILCTYKPSKEKIKEAQSLYLKAKKLRRSKEILIERIDLHKKNLIFINESDLYADYIINSKDQSEVEKMESLINLKEDLIGFILQKRQAKHKRNRIKNESIKILHLKSPSGLDIQIGKNHRQNELISIKNAKKGDIWFHSQECPGSHIVVKGSNGEIKDEDIIVAANLAAFHSKAKHNNTVSILMAPTNKLQKLKGTPPGMVSPKEMKVLWANPSDGQDYLEKSTKDT